MVLLPAQRCRHQLQEYCWYRWWPERCWCPAVPRFWVPLAVRQLNNYFIISSRFLSFFLAKSTMLTTFFVNMINFAAFKRTLWLFSLLFRRWRCIFSGSCSFGHWLEEFLLRRGHEAVCGLVRVLDFGEFRYLNGQTVVHLQLTRSMTAGTGVLQLTRSPG